MQTTTYAYPGIKTGTKLLAAVLALAGSAAMVGGNMALAQLYAANTPVAQLALASRGHLAHHVAANKCTSNAS